MTDQTEPLARAFAATLREAASALDVENGQTIGSLVLDINTLNASPDYAGACATHDFFDANMAMLAAFENVLKREPYTITEGATDVQREADQALWNAAWNMARNAGFWLDES
jgi:Tfp pilus assembly protein PilV